MIQSTAEHNVGDQRMTYRMAANAIWNKLNLALSLVGMPTHELQMKSLMTESQALADSIVHDERSGNNPNTALSGPEAAAGSGYAPKAGSQSDSTKATQ